MKLNLSLLAGVAMLAAVSGASAQTAVTDPVGYITLPVAGASGSAPAISYIGASLVNKIEFSGATSAAGASSTATFAASTFTAGQFGLNSLGQPLYYVELTSGAGAGVWTDIASNTDSALTLADPIGAMFTSGATVKIRKHHTLATLFGDGTPANPLKFTGGVDTSGADVLELISPTGVTQLFYNTDEESWVSGAVLANDYVIAPGEGIKVRRRGPAVGIVQVGHVKTGPTTLPVESGTNLIAIPRAVGSSFNFGNSNLLASGLAGGVDTSGADVVTQISGSTVSQIFYNTDEEAFFSGATNANLFQLDEGTSIRIQVKGAAFNWMVPAETIAN